MSLYNFFSINFYNLSVLLKPRRRLLSWLRVLIDYTRITFKDVFINKILSKKLFKEKVNGITIHFLDFDLFRSLFEEIFIEEQYMFFTNKKKPLIVDCGTNIGMGVVYVKSVYTDSRIICFEPDPGTYEILKKNIEVNNFCNVTTHMKAISGEKGKMNFFIESAHQSSLGMSLYEEAFEQDINAKEKITVQSVLLSDYINEIVDLLKIDVEGAEFEVFTDLDINNKFKLINQVILEGHVFNNEMQLKIPGLLNILDKNNFKYLISTPFGLSNTTKIDNWRFMLYAQKNEMI